MQNQLHTDIRYLKGVGEKRAELFQRLGVDSIDALLHFTRVPTRIGAQRFPLQARRSAKPAV